MARSHSYQRQGIWEFFEVTTRCHQGRFLMGASEEAGQRVLGVIGRALSLYGTHVRVHVVVGVSNHLHLIISTSDSLARRNFLSHINGNISKELGRLHDWPQALVGRRARTIVVLDNPAIRARAIYLVAHGRKEGLLDEDESWPGLPIREALLEGQPLTGIWYDRSALYYAHRNWEARAEATRGPEPTEQDFAEEYAVPLAPLPYVFEDAASQRKEWEAIYRDMAIQYPVMPHPVGKERLEQQDPQFRPEKTSRKFAPKAHYTSVKAFVEWKRDYRNYVDAHREFTQALADCVLGKKKRAPFPAGGVPPAELLPAFARAYGGIVAR